MMLLAFLIPLSGMPAFSQVRIDHSKANVDGKVGFSVWPMVNGAAGEPAGYEGVLAPLDQRDAWLRFPAGQWQVFPPGDYQLLLEGDFEVTPHPNKLHWVHEPFGGRGIALVRMLVPAGRVHAGGDCGSDECLAWMLHESSNRSAAPGYWNREMLRWSKLNVAREAGVLMPAGRVAVGLYDATHKEFIAVGVPIEVEPRRSTTVQPVPPPKGRSALILELIRPTLIEKPVEKDVEVALLADAKVQPDLVTRTPWRIIAVWSDAPAGLSRVEVSSPDVYLPRSDLRLRPGKVQHVELKLQPLPKLGVKWSIPDELRRADATLKIASLEGEITIPTIRLEGATNPVELPVPTTPLEVSLRSGSWSITKTVDLSDGIDRTVEMEMRPIRVTGRVYYGDRPVRAGITFSTLGGFSTSSEFAESLKVQTNGDGEFEALFAKPDVYMALVDLEGRANTYTVPDFNVQGDTTIDVRLPANEYRFRVTREDDGRPIEGARIEVSNRDAALNVSTIQVVATDAQGSAAAPPLRPGTVKLDVNADGFVRMTRPEEPVVAEGLRTIELRLAAVGATDTLTLLLPDGRPAAGAKVLIQSDGNIRVETADAHGRAQVPRADSGGLILVRAPGAALKASAWRGADQQWTLDPPVEPLVVRAVSSSGSAVAHARGVLWLDGVRLSGALLAWVTSSMTAAATDAAGYWVLRDLPQRPLHVLLWSYTESNYALASQQHLDSLRTAIRPPWAGTIDVKVVE